MKTKKNLLDYNNKPENTEEEKVVKKIFARKIKENNEYIQEIKYRLVGQEDYQELRNYNEKLLK